MKYVSPRSLQKIGALDELKPIHEAECIDIDQPASVTGITDAGGFRSRSDAGLERTNRLERFVASAPQG